MTTRTWGSAPGTGTGTSAGVDALVVAVHGITASGAAWSGIAPRVVALAEAAGSAVTVLAPDLRGRGTSEHRGGPYGLAQHADDLADLLERSAPRRQTPIVVVGHSMGAFVTAVLAARHPGLASAAVLVDGGLPLEPPVSGDGGDGGDVGTDPVEATLGPTLRRLHSTYASPAEHRQTWARHPALAGPWNAAVEDYVAADLVPGPDGWRVPVSEDAVRRDHADLFDAGLLRPGLDVLARAGTPLLLAPRGLTDADPLYPAASVARWQAELPGLRVSTVPDVNHYTVLFDDDAAATVASEVVRAVADAVRTSPAP